MTGIKEINQLFNKLYEGQPQLRSIITIHSEQVAKKALLIWKDKKLPLHPRDIYNAAMLHDIGVVKCSAPDIKAYGELPYLQHGLKGQEIVEDSALREYASICSTHTSSGLTKEEIKANNLPLPELDLLPKTLLEKLICYADKFYSKSHDLMREKTTEEIMREMKRYGEGTFKRFLQLHQLLGDNSQ